MDLFLGFVCLFLLLGFLWSSELKSHYVAQVGLDHRDRPASTSQVLGLKVSTPMPALHLFPEERHLYYLVNNTKIPIAPQDSANLLV